MNKVFDINKKRLCCLIVLLLIIPLKLLPQEASTEIQDFSNPYKYGWTDEESRLQARDYNFLQNMLLEEYNSQKQSPMINAFKTAIAPGWGHFSLGSYTKGQIFLASQLVLLGSGIYYREKAMIEYSKYEKATQIDDINRYYESAITPYRQSSLLLTLLVIVWGYTIYDVINETNEYNWTLWDRLSEDYISSNVTITPTSITFRF